MKQVFQNLLPLLVIFIYLLLMLPILGEAREKARPGPMWPPFPSHQVIILFASLLLLLIFVPRQQRYIRLCSLVFFSIAIILIPLQYRAIMKRPPFYSHQRQIAVAISMYNRDSLVANSANPKSNFSDAELEMSFPPGWVSESSGKALLSRSTRIAHPVRYVDDSVPTMLWHTPLTGMHGWRTTTYELWYPGGKLKDAIGKIDYRERK
ncbi:MAG: hypothetical protein ACYDBB_15315 [Armatimonadota bacterium]